MSYLVRGAISGIIATVPMTVFMFKGHSKLAPRDQYPLPPREIVDDLAEKAGVREFMSEKTMEEVTWFSHFSYGAFVGALYAGMKSSLPGDAFVKGTTFGLAVWSGSYLGWLPALNILKPATEHPYQRNILMIAAHVVLGTTLAIADDYLEEKFELTPNPLQEKRI